MQTVLVESSHCLASQVCISPVTTLMHVTIIILFSHILIDLSKFAKVNLSPFSLQILGERNSNVAADREIFCGDAFCQKLKWEAILTRIDNLFPGKLLCLHVC